MALASGKIKLNILFMDEDGGNDFVYVFDNKDLDSEAKKLFEGLVKKYNIMSKNDDLEGFDSDKKTATHVSGYGKGQNKRKPIQGTLREVLDSFNIPLDCSVTNPVLKVRFK